MFRIFLENIPIFYIYYRNLFLRYISILKKVIVIEKAYIKIAIYWWKIFIIKNILNIHF